SENVAQMLLGERRADRTDGNTYDACRFSRPCALTVGTGRMVDGVLEDTRDRPVVLGRYEHEPVRRRDLRLEPLDRRRLVVVVVLIVKREIADLDNGECEIRRGELRERSG